MNRKAAAIQSTWIPARERKWFFVFFGVTVTLVLFGLWNMLHMTSIDWHGRHFKQYFMRYGSIARILLFAVLANYVLLMIIKQGMADRWLDVKKILLMLLKISRRFHTPLAIITIGVIILHIIGAFLYGLKMDFTTISGLSAGLVLIGVPVAGIFRYRRLDRRWHMRLGLTFAVLFLLHAYL